jgi:hypothetical protein
VNKAFVPTCHWDLTLTATTRFGDSDRDKIVIHSAPRIKKHVQEMFEKLGVETRGAATIRALEVQNAESTRRN